MTSVPTEADRLFEAGRKKLLRTCLLWGCPLLALVVFTALHCARVLPLEEYFEADPRAVCRALAALALFQFLIVAIGVFQGWSAMRRARKLRKQSAPGKSEGASGQAR